MLQVLPNSDFAFSPVEGNALLRKIGLVDSAPEAAFDELVSFAHKALSASLASLAIFQPTGDRVFIKSYVGGPDETISRRDVPLSRTLCQFIEGADAPLVIEDVEQDPRLARNLLARAHGVRGYLGCPVRLPDGQVAGALCVTSDIARIWSRDDIALLRRIAAYIDDAIAMAAARERFIASDIGDLCGQPEVPQRAALAGRLWTGLEQEQFIPYYQPQFDARTMKIVGVEALMRWDHPTRGVLTPAAFMSAATDLSLLPRMDAAVAERAGREIADLARDGYRIDKLSLNVTAATLRDPEAVRGLMRNRMPNTRISLEILESVLLGEDDEEYGFDLDLLREQGFSIEIDDFGSGHASIIGLLHVQPDTLKIDRRLVIPAISSLKYRRILRSIIEMARSLGISTIAEGVETAEHVELLRDLGCDILQGFHLAKPMSLADLRAMMTAH